MSNIWYAFYRDPPVDKTQVANSISVEGERQTISAAKLLMTRPALSLTVGFFLVNFANFFLGWFPSYLVQSRGAALADLAVLGPLPTVASIAGDLPGGITADALYRHGWSLTAARRTCLIGGLVAAT